ncbi:CLUMA_CG019702, isoform A [Clunio marinus]|uniref:CLUMA_CG019702, isoform A n=1 Tax=Clunio marinus TaxID=568069 RepID=A0A1J1J471_9DIPT|nr:CLUMA_CG019702, isoform A [Clunio marinus]
MEIEAELFYAYKQNVNKEDIRLLLMILLVVKFVIFFLSLLDSVDNINLMSLCLLKTLIELNSVITVRNFVKNISNYGMNFSRKSHMNCERVYVC